MSALLLAMVLAAEPAPDFRLQVGGQVGFPFLLGVHSVGTFFVAGRPRFDVDATWEGSVALQSYSVGGAYHVADSVFFVGPRVRLMQFQPPWARGEVPLYFGVGGEIGVRLRVGEEGKGVVSIALNGTYVPAQAVNLKSVLGLTVGFSWSVFER